MTDRVVVPRGIIPVLRDAGGLVPIPRDACSLVPIPRDAGVPTITEARDHDQDQDQSKGIAEHYCFKVLIA